MKGAMIITLAILLLLPLASAATEITVKTEPARTVFITVLENTDTYTPINAPTKYMSDVHGMTTHTYSNEKSGSFKVLVIVKFFEEQEFREEFGPFSPGEKISIELLPDDYVDPFEEYDLDAEAAETASETQEENSTEETNETSNETTSVEEETRNSAITGNIISSSETDENFMKIAYYALGAIIIIALLVFVIGGVVIRNKRKPPRFGMEPTKLTPQKPALPKPTDTPRNDDELDRIEREIRSVEKEIEQIKRSRKLTEEEKILEEKRKILAQLKKEKRYS